MMSSKRIRRVFFSAILSLLLSGCHSASFAADITVRLSNIQLSGEIVPGDAERMAVALSQSKFDLRQLTVNSMGGNVREALRIAGLVRGTHLEVIVEKNGFCVSSCFFIFLGGYFRLAGWASSDGELPPPNKRREFFGLVGIHRPYLKSNDGGSQAFESQEQIIRTIRQHLARINVPQYLVDEMMAHPSNDVYWLRLRDLEALGAYDAEIEEALIARCGYRRSGVKVDENWTIEKMEQLNKCSTKFWEKVFLPIQRELIGDLKSGQRPWVLK